MKPIPVLGIPHYNRPDLLERCLHSIDYPVDTLALVRNGPLEMFPVEFVRQLKAATASNPDLEVKKFRRIEVLQHPNAGCAGSWNEIIKLFPGGAQGTARPTGHYWMLANNDIQFAPGDLAKMAVFVESHLTPALSPKGGEGEKPGMIYGNHGASWFAITEAGVECAGLFDENIYPAYLEDCDMSRRFDLLALRRCNVPDVHALHGTATNARDQGKGSCTVNADPKLAELNSRTHGNNFEYYRAKWGGINGQEKFTTPFNDPHWPLWAWKFDPARRAKQNLF